MHSLATMSLDLADTRYDREVMYDHVESPNVCSLPVPASDRDTESLPLHFLQSAHALSIRSIRCSAG